MTLTTIIIIATIIVSLLAFSNQELMGKLIFNPYLVSYRNEWFRFISSGFIHADWIHLLINMLVFYSFGTVVEQYYSVVFGEHATLYFLILYFGALVISIAPSFVKHKKDFHYNALGASGAVSAVLFSAILFDPLAPLLLYGFIKLPAVVVGVLYIIYEYSMGKKGGDNINHDAHLWGAIFGFAYTIGLKPSLLLFFIEKVTGN